MSENALRLITGVRPPACLAAPLHSPFPCGGFLNSACVTPRTAQLVVTVTGYQLYNDANEFYFSHECVRLLQSSKNTTGDTHTFPSSLLTSCLLYLCSAAGAATARAS